MRSNKIGFGIFLISIGILWTLMSIGILNWSVFGALYKLWPLLIIAAGINIIFRNNAIVRTVVWLVLLAVIVSYGYFVDVKYDSGRTVTTGHTTYEKLAETKNGELKVGLGGIKLDLDSKTDNLLESDISGSSITKKINYNSGKDTAFINFDRSKNFFPNPDSINEECQLHLSNDVIWNMEYKVGATKGDLDMTDLKIKDLNVDVGAGKFDIIFGDKYKSTNVKINAGASSFDLTIPKSTGVRVKMNEAITKTNFKELGFAKIDDYYTSPEYASAENKIDMEVHMGVGKFEINMR